tara:strand:+ start:9705 stop:10151 length:447 start_codon:yes stop_codon:yes gene_type:complete
MNELEKIRNLFSPLDLLVVEKEYQYMTPVGDVPDVPDDLYDDLRFFLCCGDYSDRNPSVWKVFQGEKVDETSNIWKDGMMNYYRATCIPKISNLDNDRNHISTTAKFEILIINAKSLPNNAFEGVKCAIVKTSFGDYPLLKIDDDSTE